MGGKTLTRADLAEAVYRKVGLSRTESAQLVEMVLDEICEAIVRGETPLGQARDRDGGEIRQGLHLGQRLARCATGDQH